jgi:hypothetical protein
MFGTWLPAGLRQEFQAQVTSSLTDTGPIAPNSRCLAYPLLPGLPVKSFGLFRLELTPPIAPGVLFMELGPASRSVFSACLPMSSDKTPLFNEAQGAEVGYLATVNVLRFLLGKSVQL